MSTHTQKILEAIKPEIGIELTDDAIGEDDLLHAIKVRVSELLDQDPALLFSYLYRLDVLEVDLKRVLSWHHGQNPVDSISELILERQKNRIATKEKYRQPPIEGWEW